MHANSQRQLPALILAAWLGLCSPLTAGPAPASDPELQAAETRARDALTHTGNAPERTTVRHLFEALEKDHPRDIRLKNAFAEFLWENGEFEAAAGRWRDAANLEPRNAVVLNHLGGAHLRAGDTRAALRCFTDAAAAEPANALYHFNVANVAFLFRHDLGIPEPEAFALAMEHFADAADRAPMDADYARAYAEAFYTVPDADWFVRLGRKSGG